MIIFACVHNAGRSQIAKALFNSLAINDNLNVVAQSAGTNPELCVHPEVIQAMQEIGIDLTKEIPQMLTQQLATSASLLVTMGCNEKCPYIPGLKIIDWKIEDPQGKSIIEVRKIRDEIKFKVTDLILELKKNINR